MSDGDVILTYFEFFLGCLWLYLNSIEVTNIIRVSLGNAYINSLYVSDISIIKYLGIHLQLSQILEMKSFGISWWLLIVLLIYF